MKSPYFIASLNSRLGLQNPPIGSDTLNIGVEQGGIAIKQELKKSLPTSFRTLELSFPLPDTISKQDYFNELKTLYAQASTQLVAQWQENETLLSLGGDHSISAISLNAVLHRFNPKKTGVIMFDSHADLNTIDTSPTGNFHGMWLRTFVDPTFGRKFHAENITLDPKHLTYIGNLELDPAEIEFINKHSIAIYSSTDAVLPNYIALSNWIQQFEHIHISFDIDVFAEFWVQSTGTPNPNGFTPVEVFPFLEIVRTHQSISLDLVEFNPLKKTHEKTLVLLLQVLKYLLSDFHQKPHRSSTNIKVTQLANLV